MFGGIIGFLGDLKAFLLGFAWQLCALAAVVLAIAGAIPLPQLRYARHLALILALVAANLHGRSSSGAHYRLKEAREALEREQRVVAWQQSEIRRQEEKAAQNEKRVLELGKELLAAEITAADERKQREELERSNVDVKTYMDEPVPAGLRGSFAPRGLRK